MMFMFFKWFSLFHLYAYGLTSVVRKYIYRVFIDYYLWLVSVRVGPCTARVTNNN